MMQGMYGGNNNSGAAGGGEAGAAPANPFGGGMNPFAAMGGMGGMGGLGGMGGFGAPAQQQDSRPPEEQYATQLEQLNGMGFYEFDRNVRALRMSGGSVEGAIEVLFSGTI
jgi:ubiquilin